MKVKILILVASLSITAYAQQGGSISLSRDQEERVQQIIKNLAPDSILRTSLEHGVRGSGIHRPWMDKMRIYGIRLAFFTIQYEWKDKVLRLKFKKVNYFSAYEGEKAQIKDRESLRRIREEGLEQELREVILAEYRKRDDKWSPEYAQAGEIYYYLFDDEVLPSGEWVT